MSGSAPAGSFGATCSISPSDESATPAMRDDTLLPFHLPAVSRKQGDGRPISSDGGLVLLREAERSLGLAAMPAGRKTLFQLAELLAVEDPLIDAPVG